MSAHELPLPAAAEDLVQRCRDLDSPEAHRSFLAALRQVASGVDRSRLDRILAGPVDAPEMAPALLLLSVRQPPPDVARLVEILLAEDRSATPAAAFCLAACFPDDDAFAAEILLGPDLFSPPRLRHNAQDYVLQFMGLSGEARFVPWLDLALRHRFHFCRPGITREALAHLGALPDPEEVPFSRSITAVASSAQIVVTDDERFSGSSQCVHCRFFPCRINRYHYGAIEDCKLWNRTDPADLLEIRDLRSWRAPVPPALRCVHPAEELRAAREEIASGRFVAAFPRLCAVLAQEGEAQAEVWQDLARCLQAIGEDAVALEAAAAATASSKERRWILHRAQFFLGCHLEEKGEHGAAAAVLRSAIPLADHADDKVACAAWAADSLASSGDLQDAYRLLLLLESEVREAADPDCLAVWAAKFIELHHALGGKGEPAVLRAIRDKLPAELLELPAPGALPGPAKVQQALALLEDQLAGAEPEEVERRHGLLVQVAMLKAAEGAYDEAFVRLDEAEALGNGGIPESVVLDRKIVAARLRSQTGDSGAACALFAEVWPRLRQESSPERQLEVAGYYLEALGRSKGLVRILRVGELVDTVIDLYDEVLLRQPGSAARRQIRGTHQRVFEGALLALLSLAESVGAESAGGQFFLSRAWSVLMKSRNPELQIAPAPPSEEHARRLRGLEDSLHRALVHDLAHGTISWSWLSFLEKVTAYEISTLRTDGHRRLTEVSVPPRRGVAVAFFQFRDLIPTGFMVALLAQEGRFRVHPIPDAAGKVMAPLAGWARRLRGDAIEENALRGKKRAQVEEIMEEGENTPQIEDHVICAAAAALLPRDLPGLGPEPDTVPWFLFPDGELHGLPLEVVPDPGDGGHLGRRLALRFCLRPTVPVECEERIDFARGWLGLGGAPAFAVAGGELCYLPGTRQEVVSLRDDLAASGCPAEALLGEEAHADRLAERITALRPSVLHLAVHGRPHPEHSDACALILAAAPGSAELELLPFRRIRDLPLAGVQLVVLSACSSLIGPTDTSAGIEGIAWAFLQAGAVQVIASRYTVDDRDTCKLMSMLYRHLREHPVAEALRWMREEAQKEKIPRREIGAWAVWS